MFKKTKYLGKIILFDIKRYSLIAHFSFHFIYSEKSTDKNFRRQYDKVLQQLQWTPTTGTQIS